MEAGYISTYSVLLFWYQLFECMLIDLKPIYKVSSHPFVLSVLVLDAFGGAVHRWIGEMASLF